LIEPAGISVQLQYADTQGRFWFTGHASRLAKYAADGIKYLLSSIFYDCIASCTFRAFRQLLMSVATKRQSAILSFIENFVLKSWNKSFK
jgi:hypothetical protein